MNEADVFKWIVQGGSFSVLVWIIYKAFPTFQANLAKIADDFRADLKEMREQDQKKDEANRQSIHGLRDAVNTIGNKVALHNAEFHPAQPAKLEDLTRL